MQLRLGILLLFDAHGPEAFYPFLRLLGRVVAVAFVRVDFRDAQGEEGEREEFEDFGGGGFGCDGWEGGVFRGGFLVGGGLEGAEGAFDWAGWVSRFASG